MVTGIYNETKDLDYLIWLNDNERRMDALIKCINSRYFHHTNCYKSSDKHRISTTSNEGHMRNLTVLCSGLLKLYVLYETKLKEYNDNSQTKKPNLLLDLNTECADNCRNALKGPEVKEILEKLNFKLKPKYIHKLETTSPRSYSSPKRSRRKASYKVKNEKMKKIMSEYIDRYG